MRIRMADARGIHQVVKGGGAKVSGMVWGGLGWSGLVWGGLGWSGMVWGGLGGLGWPT